MLFRSRHNFFDLVVFLLFILQILLVGCAGPKEVSKMSREEKTKLVNDVWETACASLKANLRDDMLKYVKYTKRPTVKLVASTWNLRWQNTNVPIPAIKYRDVLVLPGPHMDDIDLMFIEESGLVVSLRKMTDFIPLDQVVSNLSLLMGRTVSTELAREFSAVLFERPLAITEVIDLGYRHTPDDITCEKKNIKTEIPTLVGLMVKAGGGTDVLATYRELGEYRGWVEKSNDKGGITWQAFLATSSPNDILMVGYHTPKQHDYMHIGLGVGYIQESSNNKLPSWWQPLNELMHEISYYRLDQLRKAFAEAGLGEKSLDSVEQYIKLIQN